MKNFVDYLTESAKTYKFHIRAAGELPEGCAKRMEMALKKYDLKKLSSGKTGPITERPLDFPSLSNIEVTHFEAEVSYPATSQIIRNHLSEICKIPESHLVVRAEGEPIEDYQEQKDDKPYETLLDKEDMGGESAQKNVAGNRVMDLLKELEQARKEREHDPIEGAPKGESKDIDESENSKSVMGS